MQHSLLLPSFSPMQLFSIPEGPWGHFSLLPPLTAPLLLLAAALRVLSRLRQGSRWALLLVASLPPLLLMRLHDVQADPGPEPACTAARG